MMKRFVVGLLLYVFGTFSVGAIEKYGLPEEELKYLYTNYYWSYAALAQTMRDMRLNCEPTRKDEFLEIGNWVREHDAFFNRVDLIDLCNQLNPDSIVRTVENSCKYPKETKCIYDKNGILRSCGEIPYTGNKWCDIFISYLIENHNSVVRKLGVEKNNPGTYVERIVDSAGRRVYRVLDVVLADGYYVSDGDASLKTSINQAVNQADENTKIWEWTGDTFVQVSQCRTWTNDMFLDVQATAWSVQGGVRGAAFGSYIFCDSDVTQDVYKMYDERRGIMGAFVLNAIDSLPGGKYDIKEELGKRYAFAGQQGNESESNGVMFNGRIATIDFLGNMLYGMNREETLLPDRLANQVADVVSMATNGFAVIEPEHVRNAWDMGAGFVNTTEYDYEFQNTQTKYESLAYDMARKRMMNVYHAVSPITCSGNCNPVAGTQDVVVCTDANGVRREFVFDDICD